MIICESPFLFHRRDGQGEQSSLAFKETCIKPVSMTITVFDKVKMLLFYMTIEKF